MQIVPKTVAQQKQGKDYQQRVEKYFQQVKKERMKKRRIGFGGRVTTS